MLVFKEPPPRISSTRHTGKNTAEERQKRQNTLNRADVSKLKTFEFTNFRDLLRRRTRAVEHCNHQQKSKKRPREILDEEQGHDERKRRKFDLEYLYGLIAHPHYHANLTVATDPATDIRKHFKPFAKTPFTHMEPYSEAKVDGLFHDGYARAIWMIPISGAMPWAQATEAILIDDNGINAPEDTFELKIRWTPLLVKKLWEDLLEIRKGGTVGPIAISYIISEAGKGKRASAYIKLYHDVSYSLYIRKVLDAWRTAVPPKDLRSQPGVPSSAKRKQARPLLGAKLMLLDEVNQVIGFC